MKINTDSKQKTTQILAARKIINGEDAGMLQLLPYKYQFAEGFFDSMYSNSWHPAEVNMNEDAAMWKDKNALNKEERKVFSRSLSFISNLDTVQTYSLMHALSRQFTAPELQILLVRQTFEETIHVLSYNRMIELLGLDPEDTYGRYRKDKDLKKKLDFISQSINIIMDKDFKTGTLENNKIFAEALVNNILLEGLQFYASFLQFYAFARNGKMLNSARMIGLINRDEATHCALITQIFKLLMEENPEIWTQEFKQIAINKVKEAAELEIEWGISLIGNGISGINPENLTQYIQFLADLRLDGMNLPKLYNVTNPFSWIDEYTQINQELGAFFETSVSRYSQEQPDFEQESLQW
jgi:ribonucleoside-diphosphate reductase beta chain